MIIDDIKRIVSLHLGIRDIENNDRFMEDLNAESLDVMNIIASVEEKFNLVILESEIPELQTPSALATLVENRMNGQNKHNI